MMMGVLKVAACWWNPQMRSVLETKGSVKESSSESKKFTPQTNSLDPESSRQHFRSFYYPEAVGPLQVVSQLQELCHRWLRPEIHSKERVLELLVLEQFLAILPRELQTQIQKHHPQSIEEAVALVQHFQGKSDQRRNEVRRKIPDIYNEIGYRWD
uniref:SCAN box domain-containing protein n=1 Tax=Loxodonta africana TaxID=9785 RepID=G3TYS0_LOXAF